MKPIDAKTAGRLFVLLISLLLIVSVGLEAAGAADSKAVFTVQ